MSTLVTVIVIVAAVVVLALVVAAVWSARRRASLRSRFGPEYDQTIAAAGSRRAGERELRDRASRRDELDIRPLDPRAAERYCAEWRLVQERFVDAPAESVAQAHTLVTAVMSDRGYPTSDDDERTSMLSVDHADVMAQYRTGMRTEQEWRSSGTADTEELRQAMRHYRDVFDRLVGETGAPAYPEDRSATNRGAPMTTPRTPTD
jgi:hypothetical protein